MTLRLFLINAAILMAVAAPGSAAEWTTSYGQMTLPDAPSGGPVRANYTDDSGRIIGQLLVPKCMDCGVVLRGIWVEAGSAERCTTEEDGSHHWGNVELTFNPSYTSFEGGWDYCGGGSTRSWRGQIGITRIPQKGSK